jgi:hypothetical protein
MNPVAPVTGHVFARLPPCHVTWVELDDGEGLRQA